jgi:hypothetical protein
MSLKNRLTELVRRHKELDESIKQGHTNYLDDEHMGKMKFEKAHIKREIEEIKIKLKAVVNEA